VEVVARWVLGPILRAWVASKTEEVEGLPRPSDEPEWHAPGPDPHRVLIFGGGPAVGWGVLSHALALPGSLARALSHRTRRGAQTIAWAVPRLKIDSALKELGRIELGSYDALVVTMGINDAGGMTSLKSWEQGMSTFLRVIKQRSSTQLQIFVAGVHPIRSIPVYDSPLGSIVEAHATKMNAITDRICENLPSVTYVALTAPEPSGSVRFRDAKTYRHWAEELAERMAPQLDADGRTTAR